MAQVETYYYGQGKLKLAIHTAAGLTPWRWLGDVSALSGAMEEESDESPRIVLWQEGKGARVGHFSLVEHDRNPAQPGRGQRRPVFPREPPAPPQPVL
ncbi:Uncharacterised protein [Pseudomonas aeruginosa]|nr:Uncharacterised protein [Pseudomonas aeruginosa]